MGNTVKGFLKVIKYFYPPFFKSFCVFRPGQFLSEIAEAETGMYALLKDTSGMYITLNYYYLFCAGLFC